MVTKDDIPLWLLPFSSRAYRRINKKHEEAIVDATTSKELEEAQVTAEVVGTYTKMELTEILFRILADLLLWALILLLVMVVGIPTALIIVVITIIIIILVVIIFLGGLLIFSFVMFVLIVAFVWLNILTFFAPIWLIVCCSTCCIIGGAGLSIAYDKYKHKL